MFVDASPEQIIAIFGALVADPERLLAWHTLFMAMTLIVVARGVRSGLERAVKYMMPALLIILLVLVGYAMNSGKFMDGYHYLFDADFSRITGKGILIALGHAFFTLSLGMGAIMVYGAYLPQHVSIARATVAIALLDTVVALLAGLAIFPLVFANRLSPVEGPSLVLKTLPIAFGHMPGGTLFGSLFFILLVFAAWTSSISLAEPAVAWLVENHHMTRVKAVTWSGIAAWLLGIASVLSFNRWSGFAPFSMVPGFETKTFFDLLDFLASNILLPLGGLLIALFAGWVMSRASSAEELALGNLGYRTWRFVLRYIAPLAILLVFLNLLGVLDVLRRILAL
jgi:NSS family neurotransmitter:Na+ symporter